MIPDNQLFRGIQSKSVRGQPPPHQLRGLKGRSKKKASKLEQTFIFCSDFVLVCFAYVSDDSQKERKFPLKRKLSKNLYEISKKSSTYLIYTNYIKPFVSFFLESPKTYADPSLNEIGAKLNFFVTIFGWKISMSQELQMNILLNEKVLRNRKTVRACVSEHCTTIFFPFFVVEALHICVC